MNRKIQVTWGYLDHNLSLSSLSRSNVTIILINENVRYAPWQPLIELKFQFANMMQTLVAT